MTIILGDNDFYPQVKPYGKPRLRFRYWVEREFGVRYKSELYFALRSKVELRGREGPSLGVEQRSEFTTDEVRDGSAREKARGR